jgi:hypothetical protein
MNPTRPAQASFRDRTNEFRAAVESARRQSSAPAEASSSSTGPLDGLIAATSARSEFNNRASKIGLGIHQTSQKLSRLAKCMAFVLFLPVLLDSLFPRCFRLAELLVIGLAARSLDARRVYDAWLEIYSVGSDC